MRLRHDHFYTLSSLNQRIRELLVELNHRQQRVHPGSRHELYIRLDKPALMPLPAYGYQYIDSKQARVGPDYHVLYAKHEILCRDNTKVKRLTRQAKLRFDARASGIDYRSGRGLKKEKVATLLSGQYLHYNQNIIITGATGCGKTHLACALATQACEQHHSARYYRLGELLDELHVGHADGSYRQQLNTLAKRKLLILDDWGMEKLSARQANDLLDVMEIRYQQSSTIIASQIPTSEWYKLIPSPTIADALLDRLLHNSHRIELTGESMRKLDQSDHLA